MAYDHQDWKFNLTLTVFCINTKLIYFPVIHEESAEEGGRNENEQPSEEAAVICMFTFTH